MYYLPRAIIGVHSKGGHSKSCRSTALQVESWYSPGKTYMFELQCYTFATFAIAPFAMHPNNCSRLPELSGVRRGTWGWGESLFFFFFFFFSGEARLSPLPAASVLLQILDLSTSYSSLKDCLFYIMCLFHDSVLEHASRLYYVRWSSRTAVTQSTFARRVLLVSAVWT